MRVLRFALGPNFLGPARIILVRKNEKEPGRGLALVLEIHLELFSCFCGLREVHAELVVSQLERGVFAVDAGAGDGEFRAIKIQVRQSVA